MDDIFSMLQPQQPQTLGQPDPGLKAQWDSVLQDPKTRGALLSFGLNLMTPSWGSPIANAMGAAAQSYAGAEDLERTRAVEERDRATSLSEKEADRKLRRDINTEDNAAAMARTRVAKEGTLDTKSQARWDRAYYFRQNKLAAENKAAREFNENPMNIDAEKKPLLSDEEILMQAEAFADSSLGKGPNGTAMPANAGGVTSQIPAGTAAPMGDKGVATSPSAAAPGASPTVASSEKPGAEAPKKVEAWRVVDGTSPQILEQLLAKPNAEEILQKKFGVTKAEIEAELARPSRRHGAAVGNFWNSLLGGGQAPNPSASRTVNPATGAK
jgi:hypothetical protein